MDCIQQVLIAKWFGQELDCPCFHGADGHGDVAVSRDKNDRSVNVGIGQMPLEIEATDPGQPDVEHQTARHIRVGALQELLCRSEQLYLQSNRTDAALDSAPNRRIIVDHKNNGRRFCHEGFQSSAGRVNSKSAPPDTATAHKRPPWDSTMERLIDRPIPMPSGLSVKNGSKIWSDFPGSISGPDS